MPSSLRPQLVSLCRDVLAPLLAADGGVLYVVQLEDDQVILHLGGTCAGCPGAPITSNTIIDPAIHSVAPAARVKVTHGALVPEGAVPADQFV